MPDSADTLSALLPVFGLTLRFKLRAPVHFGFYHQAVLRGWLDARFNGLLDGERRVWIHAPESGRADFAKGEEYRLQVFCCKGGESLFERIVLGLQQTQGAVMPDPADADSTKLRLSDQFCFEGLEDWLSRESVDSLADLCAYEEQAFRREIEFWSRHPELRLRLVSPIRIFLPAELRHGRKGETRYVRDRGQMPKDLLVKRIADSIQAILEDNQIPFAVPAFPDTMRFDSLFWVDYHYGETPKPMGGLLGAAELDLPAEQIQELLPYLVLGQLLGVGQRRSFGWGRYRLETRDRRGTAPPRRFSRSLLERAARVDRLEKAAVFILSQRRAVSRREHEDEEFESEFEEAISDAEPEDAPSGPDLEELSAQLLRGEYQVPVLAGGILQKPGKAPRPLSIPPLRDRIIQRALVEVLTPDTESLMSYGSYGYRRGLSRINAKDRIQSLYREGYRWFYESDIDDFFDSISFPLLEDSLYSLFIDDPAVDLILQWVRAPVYFRGEMIQRPSGLPQGAPISPLLANLMLTDFDADLKANEMALIRFADDYVIVCKSRERALQAAERAERSLAELGLSTNPEKTRIGRFDQGFHFLGYTFVNELAVESPGNSNRTERLPVPQNLPKSSWLAILAQRKPEVLDELEKPGQERPAKKEPVSPVRELGEIQDSGTLVYVTGEAVKLSVSQGRLLIMDHQHEIRKIPFNEIGAIILIGRHHLSTPLLLKALRSDVPIHFIGTGGRYLGVLQNEKSGHAGHLLWLRQKARFADEASCASLAISVVDARLNNQVEVLRQRRSAAPEAIEHAIIGIKRCRRLLLRCAKLSEINGYEGAAAAFYFTAIAQLLAPEFEFKGRNRRPPKDPFNALLSLGYSILYAHIESLLRVSGLLPWCGFYHQPRGRHASLASDLLEPFRHVAERSALSLVNRRQLKPEDFVDAGENGIRLTRNALRLYLTELSQRLATPVQPRDGSMAEHFFQQVMRQNQSLIEWLYERADKLHCFRIK